VHTTHRRATLWLAAIAAGATVFGAQGISPALPAIQNAFGISDSQVGLITAAYMLPGVLMAMPLGWAADRWGRRVVFSSMAFLYGAAGAAQALAPAFGVLIGLRVMQGIGYAALMPLSVTLIADTFTSAEQVKAQASRQISLAMSEFLLPVIGATLAGISWRAPLAAQGLMVVFALFALFVLDDRRAHMHEGGYRGELGLALKQPGMPAVLSAGFLRFWCKFALVGYLPTILVTRTGASMTQAAVVLSIASGVAAAINFLVVRAMRRFPGSLMLIWSVIGVSVSLVLFAFVPSWQVGVAVAVLFGLSDGTLQVLQNVFVAVAAPERVRGGLIAFSGMTRNLGKLVAPLAVGALLLVVSPTAAFSIIGVSTWAVVPTLRPLRKLDGLIRPDKKSDVLVAQEAA
jgi:MFS transporter, ACDE family, multidrug resistance protein